MFERFTDRARHVIVLAQAEARMLNHDYIGTEHVLLGLLHEEEGVGATVLESMGVSLDEVRGDLRETIGPGETTPTGRIPFTLGAKRVLELSLREALRLGHSYIGTEHILLGLVREGEGVAGQILRKRGIALEDVRAKVLQTIGERQGSEPAERPHGLGHVHGPAGVHGPSAMALFDEDAVRAIHRAQEIAARRNRTVVGSRELLLGLLQATQRRVIGVLEGLGLQVPSILRSAESLAEEGAEGVDEEGGGAEQDEGRREREGGAEQQSEE